MRLVDAHAHLADQAFVGDIDLVLAKAFETGVVAIISCAQSIEEFKKLSELSSKYSGRIFTTIGCDPLNLDEEYVERMRSLVIQNIRAIVEILASIPFLLKGRKRLPWK